MRNKTCHHNSLVSEVQTFQTNGNKYGTTIWYNVSIIFLIKGSVVSTTRNFK